MKRIALVLAASVLLSASLIAAQQTVPAGASPAQANGPVVLKKGTPVRLLLLENVTSATAHKGQSVRMAVADDVTADDGVVVIPRDAPVSGVVSYVRKAVLGRRDGEVRIKPISLTLPGNRMVSLREVKWSGGDEVCEGFGSCAELALVVAVTFPAALVGSVASWFPRQHQNVDGRDQTIEAYSALWASTAAREAR